MNNNDLQISALLGKGSPLCLLDDEGHVLFINDEFRQEVQVPHQSGLGDNLFEHIASLKTRINDPSWQEGESRRLAVPNPASTEDEERIPLWITLKIEEGKRYWQLGTVAVTDDVTAGIDQIPLPALYFHPKRGIAFVNGAGQALLGEMGGYKRALADLEQAANLNRLEAVASVSSSEQPMSATLEVNRHSLRLVFYPVRPGAQDCVVLLEALGVSDDDEVSRLRGDVHGLKQTLELKTNELASARDRAMAASRAKSGFLANMSHELRTPLNAIIGYSEILLEDIAETDNPQWCSDLKRILTAGKHLLALINDVLDLSKIEAGKMGLNLEYFRVTLMFKEVSETVSPMADKNGTKLLFNECEDSGVMLSDITKVRQILLNLLSNAIKFSENGQVKASCSRRMEGDRECLIFRVEDNGVGMSDAQLSKLFEEFFQAHEKRHDKWGGTGLGLVISQRFAQMLGGRIEVTSEEGKGSCFTVVLPVNSAKLRFQESPDGFQVGPKVDPRLIRFATNEKYADRRSRISKVLVIDDDPAVTDLMERFLSREGFDVTSVHNGPEGIQRIRDFQPDVITLDVLMPVMDGWSVLSELKSDPATAEIPVIMLSMLDEHEMSYALGADDYLIKPIKRDVLVQTVLRHIRDDEANTVMVVDDEAENREIIQRILSSHGIDIIEAKDGLDAMEKLEQGMNTDLILLDLMMPRMDGFQFCDEIRKNEKWGSVPIIVLTSQELSNEDLNRLSDNVERIYERRGDNFESLLLDIRSLVASHVRKSV